MSGPSYVAPHVDQFNDLRISKPNSNNKIEEMTPIRFDQFVTWGRMLPPDKITQAFNEGRFKFEQKHALMPKVFQKDR